MKAETKEKKEVPAGYRICGKCKGSGELHQYSHIHEGMCFSCDGTGIKKIMPRGPRQPRKKKVAPPINDANSWDDDDLPF